MKGGSFLPAFQHQKQKILRSRCQRKLATAAAYPLAGTSGILLHLQKGLRKQGIGANWQMTMVPFRRVCVCLSAVIGVQVHLFDLLHPRIPGIGAGALVVEGLLRHFVQTAQECLFGNTVFPNGVVDADFVHEFRNGVDELFKLLLVCIAVQLQTVGRLGVSGQGMGMVILGEGAHFHGNFGGIEAEDLADQQGIVGQKIFDTCGFVRNDRKGRHFGAGDFAYNFKSDDDLRASMADALDDFFGNRQDCDIF